jgi:hypothetical protein
MQKVAGSNPVFRSKASPFQVGLFSYVGACNGTLCQGT